MSMCHVENASGTAAAPTKRSCCRRRAEPAGGDTGPRQRQVRAAACSTCAGACRGHGLIAMLPPDVLQHVCGFLAPAVRGAVGQGEPLPAERGLPPPRPQVHKMPRTCRRERVGRSRMASSPPERDSVQRQRRGWRQGVKELRPCVRRTRPWWADSGRRRQR